MTGPDRDRLEQLLADQATEGISDANALELRGLLRDEPGVDVDALADEWRLAAAAVHSALGVAEEPLPASLRQTVLADARRHFAAPPAPPATFPTTRSTPVAGPGRRLADFSGWAVAAAALIFAALAWIPLAETPGTPRSVAELAALDPDLIERPWSPQNDPRFSGVAGRLVWSQKLQRGFMILDGAPVNDPKQRQYQLWIVDPTRDDHPVDGGVFDIRGPGEQVIPFEPRLPVDSPAAFALTEEQPGGVVVSRKPLVLVAAVGG